MSQHPYTWGLLESMPSIEKRLDTLLPIEGSPPSMLNPPPGCPFNPRCRYRFEPCDSKRPPLVAAARRPSRCLPAVARAQERDLEDQDRAARSRSAYDLQRIARDPGRRRPAGRDHKPDQVVCRQAERVRERQGRRPRGRGRHADRDRGETLGLVGESGCGKSTTARADASGCSSATAGTVKFDGDGHHDLSARRCAPLRRQMQMIFQDPYSSLNPRLTRRPDRGRAVRDPHGPRRTRATAPCRELLERVGLARSLHPLSAPVLRRPAPADRRSRARSRCSRADRVRRARLGARRLGAGADPQPAAGSAGATSSSPTSSSRTTSSVIRQVSDRVAVMYLGRVVELADSELLYEHPRHPYTAALLSAVPRPTVDGNSAKNRVVLTGDVPSPVNPPEACVFHPRCPRFQDGKCNVELPELRSFEPHHEAACHFPVERWPLTADELAHPFAGSTPKSEFHHFGRPAPNYPCRYSSEGINDTLAANNGLRAGLTMDLPRTRRRTRPARAGRACTPSRAVRPLSRRECGVPRVHRADARCFAGGARSTGRDPVFREIVPSEHVARDGDRSRRGGRSVRRIQRRAPLGRASAELAELREPAAAAGVRAGAPADRADLLRGGPAGVGSPVRRARASIDSPSGRRL